MATATNGPAITCPVCNLAPFASLSSLAKHLAKKHPGWVESQNPPGMEAAGEHLPAEISVLIREEEGTEMDGKDQDKEKARTAVREIVEEVLAERIEDEPNQGPDAALTSKQVEDAVYRGMLRAMASYEKISERANEAWEQGARATKQKPGDKPPQRVLDLIDHYGLMEDDSYEIFIWAENPNREQKKEIDEARKWLKENQSAPAAR